MGSIATKPAGVGDAVPVTHASLSAASNHRLARRTTLAIHAGRSIAALSRRAGHGGSMIGGRVTLALDHRALTRLSTSRPIALISGTNGKTTTTAMLTAALRTREPVATNASGSNMLDGMTAALMEHREDTAVLEIDELWLERGLRETGPQLLVLSNLTRDQLDRASELRSVVARIHTAVMAAEGLVVVANADDPSVVAAVDGAANVMWIAAGGGAWQGDAATCPRCGGLLTHDDCDQSADSRAWWCLGCGLRRPSPQWTLRHDQLDAGSTPIATVRTALPGAVNQINAAMAIAAAHVLGIDCAAANAAIAGVDAPAGRYARFRVGEHDVRLILAKNPAGWAATLQWAHADRHPVVIALNARAADGRDTSWLYDIEVEQLRGRTLVAAGERSADMSVRLAYGCLQHRRCADPVAALANVPPGPVDVIACYTAFTALAGRLAAAR